VPVLNKILNKEMMLLDHHLLDHHLLVVKENKMTMLLENKMTMLLDHHLLDHLLVWKEKKVMLV